MKKVNKQLLSLMLGIAFAGNALPVTTVFAAEDDVLPSEEVYFPVEEFIYPFTDIYDTGIYGYEFIYSDMFGVFPVIDGLSDMDFTTLPNYTSSVDDSKTILEVQQYIAESPYKDVEGNAEAVWEKPWQEATDEFDRRQPGHYKIRYLYHDSAGELIGEDIVILSLIDNIMPVVSYYTDASANPVEATVKLGDDASFEDIAEQWGLKITDNRLGNMDITGAFELEPLIVVNGKYNLPGSHAIRVPSEEWVEKFKEDNPGDTGLFPVSHLILNIEEDESLLMPKIELAELTLFAGEEYDPLHHLLNAESHDGINLNDSITASHIGVPEGTLLEEHVGSHLIDFTVTDAEGRTTTRTTYLHVVSGTEKRDYSIDAQPVEIWEGMDYSFDMHEAYGYDTGTLEEVTVSILDEPYMPVPGDSNEPGIYNITFMIDDGINIAYTVSTTLTVLAFPEIEGTGIIVKLGDLFNISDFMITALDLEDGEIEYTFDTDGIPLDEEGRYSEAGEYLLQVQATDSHGQMKAVAFDVTVIDETPVEENPVPPPIIYNPEPEPGETVNTKPVISGRNISLSVGDYWDYTRHNILSNDKEEGAIHFEVDTSKLPLGMGNVLLVSGTYDILVTSTDSEGLISTLTLTLTVTEKENTNTNIGEVSQIGNNNGEKDLDTETITTNGETATDGETIPQYGAQLDISLLLSISILLTLAGASMMMEKKNRR